MSAGRPVTRVISRLLHPRHGKNTREFLARPAEAITAPCCVTHLAFLHELSDTGRVEAGGDSWQPLKELCAFFPSHTDTLRSGPGFFRAQLDEDLWCRWELNDMFHSYTFIQASTGGRERVAFGATALHRVPLTWLASLPKDTLVSALHLEVQPHTPESFGTTAFSDSLAAAFGGNRVYGSSLHGGAVLAFTDFEAHEDGCNRVLLTDSRLSAPEVPLLDGLPGQVHLGPGRLVQQLADLEDFRCLSLIGEPWAGHMSRRVEELNRQLVQVMLKLDRQPPMIESSRPPRLPRLLDFDLGESTRQATCARSLVLDELCALHLQLEQLSAKYKPRLERSHVWYQHMCDLVDDLHEGPLEGSLSIGRFTRQRLEALIRERHRVEREAAELSLRLQRSVELIDTQVAAARLETSNATALKVERLTVIMVALSLLLAARELHDTAEGARRWMAAVGAL